MTAEKVRAIRALEDYKGRITCESLIDAARDPSHPWHNNFTWDDSLAAHERRMDQARHIINKIKIQIVMEEKTVSSVSYVRDPALPANEQGYRSVAQIRHEPDSAKKVLREEIERIRAHIQRGANLAAALDLEDEFEDLIRDADALSERLRHRLEPLGGRMPLLS